MARESIKKMLNHKTGDITSRYVHANVNSLRPMFDEIAQGLMLNYDGSYLGDAGYNGGPKGVYRQKTVPVGQFPANAFGLHDVHGNVWEWTQDCWNGSYSGAPSDGTAWTSDDCSRRVLRGGSWVNYPRDVRSASRLRNRATFRGRGIGFRISRTHP